MVENSHGEFWLAAELPPESSDACSGRSLIEYLNGALSDVSSAARDQLVCTGDMVERWFRLGATDAATSLWTHSFHESSCSSYKSDESAYATHVTGSELLTSTTLSPDRYGRLGWPARSASGSSTWKSLPGEFLPSTRYKSQSAVRQLDCEGCYPSQTETQARQETHKISDKSMHNQQHTALTSFWSPFLPLGRSYE